MNGTRRKVMLASAALIGSVAGCLGDANDDHDDHSHDDDHHDSHDEIGVHEFEVIDRDLDDVAASVHDDHWHGELPQIVQGERVSLGARVEAADGETIALGSDTGYELRVEFPEAAATDILDVDHHGDHVHLHGLDVGITDIVFGLWEQEHSRYRTPAIRVQVVE